MTLLTRAMRSFAAFWVDFLIGDTPELFLATGVIVALALVVGRHHAIAIMLLPLTAILSLVASTYRGRRRTPATPNGQEGTPQPPD
jgi:hypothetical protein